MKKIFTNQSEVEEILKDAQKVAQIFWDRGWSEKNAGNISIKLPGDILPEYTSQMQSFDLEAPINAIADACFFVTATGKRMQDIAQAAEDNGLFIKINSSGTGYSVLNISNKKLKPTSELPSHLGIHNMCAERGTGEKVVLHTHATEVIALTQYPKIKSTDALNKILWGMHPETMVFVPKGAAFVPYILPGTQEIADATIEQFKDHDIVVWEKHGIFAIGKDIVDTADNIDIVCKSAKVWFQCKSAGFEPEGMSDPQLDELRELVKKFNA